MARDPKIGRQQAARSFGLQAGGTAGKAAGTAIGGALGGPVGGVAGKYIGGALGSVAGRALGGLVKPRGVAPGYRKYLRDTFEKGIEGKVDDLEKLKYEQEAQQAGEKQIQAQAQLANQMAMAGGPVQAGLLRQQAQNIAKTGAGVEVQAKGQAAQFAAKQAERRRAAAVAAAQELMGIEKAEADLAEGKAFTDAETVNLAFDEIGEAKELVAKEKYGAILGRQQAARAQGIDAARAAASMMKGVF